MTNFLSYKSATLVFDDIVAVVGPNASGKSNAVSAIKLLREIPIHGLPVALARRGGFDKLRHRSAGRPYDPALRIEFRLAPDQEVSFYEINLGAVKGGQYRVKSESAQVFVDGSEYSFISDGKSVTYDEMGYEFVEVDAEDGDKSSGSTTRGRVRHVKQERKFPVSPGQSAMSAAGMAGFQVYETLQLMQTVEVNPARVSALQEPSSTREFEPDGSNTVSIYESLSPVAKSALVDELSAIVPGIIRIEVQRLADQQTLKFVQATASGNREFYAKQMSDGTLRAFSILLAMSQLKAPAMLVIEEPEIAIHLGALRTLVDILKQQAESAQIIITTHSADIIDSLPLDSLRVVWNDGGESHVGAVAEHTLGPVRQGLISPGELLRADSLDPAAV
ncbi:AAA family ATPase [Nocardioides marmoraquaticus]